MTSPYAISLSFGFVSPSNILTAGILLPILAFISVLLRFYVRLSWKQGIGIDDWLLVPALLMVIGIGASLVVGVKKHVMGYPTPPPKTQDILNNLQLAIVIIQQLEFVITLLLVLAYGLIKLSILCFYRRLFVPQRTTVLNYLTWISIAIIVAWTTAFLFLFIFSCGTYVAANWGSREDLIKYCGAGHAHELSLYISEFLTDIMVLIWGLQMKTARKLEISGVLLLAFMALAASIARLVLVIEITTKSYTVPYDQDQAISTLFYWGMIEAGLALTASCLPTLRVLVTSQNLHSIMSSARNAISNGPSTRSMNSEWSGRPKIPYSPRGPGLAGNTYVNIGTTASDTAPFRDDILMEAQSNASCTANEPVSILEPGRISVKKEVELRNDIV